MRLGNFFGFPAPVAMMMFNECPEKLDAYLTKVHELSPALLVDVRKEFLYLKKAVSEYDLVMPDVPSVCEKFQLDTQVIDGEIVGGTAVDNAELMVEISRAAVNHAVKLQGRGVIKSIPKNITQEVQKFCHGKVFELAEISKIARKFANGLRESDTLRLERAAAALGMVRTVPSKVSIGGRVVELNAEQKTIWKWFNDRLPEIHAHIVSCSGKAVKEDRVFGIAFFDLIKRKPISIKYTVMEVFQRVKDRQYARLLPECIAECRREIAKYRECIQKYIDFGEKGEIQLVSENESNAIMDCCSSGCKNLLETLSQEGRFRYQDLKIEDLEMLTDLCDAMYRLEVIGIPEMLGVTVSLEDVVKDACEMGVYGISRNSEALFVDALENIILQERGKIKKSNEDLEELAKHLSDIDALLDTLRPIGALSGEVL